MNATLLDAPVNDVNAGPDPRPVIDPSNHLGLAYAVANRFAPWAAAAKIPLDDLEGEAVVELVRICAANRFDPARGCQFSTFATTSLENRLRKLLKRRRVPTTSLTGEDGPIDVEDRRPAGVPVEDVELLDRLLAALSGRIRRLIVRRYGLDGQAPQTLEQLAAGEGISIARIDQVIAVGLHRMRQAAARMGLGEAPAEDVA